MFNGSLKFSFVFLALVFFYFAFCIYISTFKDDPIRNINNQESRIYDLIINLLNNFETLKLFGQKDKDVLPLV
jgi:ABC-type transport system involved in Fe-S cluster assembly fused permease/ATPase subunit